MNGLKIIYRYTVCKIRISCDTSCIMLYYITLFDSDNDSALQSHISLPFLPILISSMTMLCMEYKSIVYMYNHD